MPHYRAQYDPLNPANTSVNDTMFKCLDLVPEEVAHKIAKRIQHEWKTDGAAAEHTYHELLLGAYLASNGYQLAYERSWFGKTPDWTLLNGDGSVLTIVEVSNHHLDREQEDKMFKAHARGEVGIAYPENTERLRARLDEKAGAYSSLVKAHAVPYVVAVFGSFFAAVDAEEFNAALFGGATGDAAFVDRPVLSGAYLFQESGSRPSYIMKYVANPDAMHAITLPSGEFRYRP